MGDCSPGTQWGDNSRRPRISWLNKPRGWHGHPLQSADAIRVAGTSLGTNMSHASAITIGAATARRPLTPVAPSWISNRLHQIDSCFILSYWEKGHIKEIRMFGCPNPKLVISTLQTREAGASSTERNFGGKPEAKSATRPRNWRGRRDFTQEPNID